ncbi:MAG: response regulator transcription factor, partial [Desulfatitalea sp.]|nr:response regulator transcription factor [Desulfatitalea sp.]
MKPIRILIVEDHPIFRMGLEDLIQQEKDLVICGTAEDVAEAKKAIARLEPDMVIVDLSLKTSNGLELVRQIVQDKKELPILVLSMHDENVHAERCLLAGARGYINKEEASELVIRAIRQILRGEIFLSEKMISNVLKKYKSRPGDLGQSPIQSLTARELEVLHLVGKGLRTSDIAGRLNLSVKTIGTHKERIKEKLGLKSSLELIRYAIVWVER